MTDALRELDVRMAQEVFGQDTEQLQWCVTWKPIYQGTGPYNEKCVRCGTFRGGARGRSGPCVPPIPLYSSDIAAAMLVAERVGGRLELDGYHGQGWTATLRGQRYFAPTPAEAICRAALLAVGAERQGGEGE